MSNAQEQLTFQPLTLAVSDDLAGLVIDASASTHGDKMGLTNVEVVPQLDSLPCPVNACWLITNLRRYCRGMYSMWQVNERQRTVTGCRLEGLTEKVDQMVMGKDLICR